MGKNQNTWSHRTKSYCTPSEASQVFPPKLSLFDRKTSDALGTHHVQATVTMATSEKRFHVPSEEEIDKLLTDKDSINTQKATKLSVKCFRDYLREQDPDNVEFSLGYWSWIFIVVDVVFKCLRQRSNGLKICLPAVFFFTCMCFLCFIRYNKKFMACGFRKYI